MKRALALVALGAVTVAAVAMQRARSPFLRIEGERQEAEAIAAASGVTVEDAMALRELAGVDAPVGDVQARATEFAKARARLGADELAVLVFDGHGALAEELLAASGDARAAVLALRSRPEGATATRFLAMRERFGARLEAAERR